MAHGSAFQIDQSCGVLRLNSIVLIQTNLSLVWSNEWSSEVKCSGSLSELYLSAASLHGFAHYSAFIVKGEHVQQARNHLPGSHTTMPYGLQLALFRLPVVLCRKGRCTGTGRPPD